MKNKVFNSALSRVTLDGDGDLYVEEYTEGSFWPLLMSNGDWGGVVGKGNEVLPILAGSILHMLVAVQLGLIWLPLSLETILLRVTSGLHVAKFKGYVLVFLELKLSEALYAIDSPSCVKCSLPMAFMTPHSPSFLLYFLLFVFSLSWRFIPYYLIRKYWCAQVCISSPEPSFQLQACVFSCLFQISSWVSAYPKWISWLLIPNLVFSLCVWKQHHYLLSCKWDAWALSWSPRVSLSVPIFIDHQLLLVLPLRQLSSPPHCFISITTRLILASSNLR